MNNFKTKITIFFCENLLGTTQRIEYSVTKTNCWMLHRKILSHCLKNYLEQVKALLGQKVFYRS